MPETTFVAQVLEAELPLTAWEEAYFALTAVKGLLQSLPGFSGMEVLGELDEAKEQVKLVVISRWQHPEQLEAWLKTQETPYDVLTLMEPPPLRLEARYLAELA